MSKRRTFAVLLLSLLAACSEARDDRAPAPAYQTEVKAILDAKCVRCHAGNAAPAGWRADSFLGAVGCTERGEIATRGPIARALTRADHADLLTANERTTLDRWLAGGALGTRAGTHPASFADPRAPNNHARFLRDQRWRPMLDRRDKDACGKCHDGVARAPDTSGFAPGATACTSCHAEPGGVFACSTCHGSPGKPAPPRDACFFPSEPKDTSHPAHTLPGAASTGIACSACHPQPKLGDLSETHGNGHVEVWLDSRWDPATKRCAGTCHARGGARPELAWNERGPITCNDCHRTPPASHYAGPCTSCHHEANADGTSLTNPTLHMRGEVVLGDGSGRCGACHGTGDDPWPTSGAHRAHASPKSAAPVPCETCHDLPKGKHPLGGGARIRLFGIANAGGRKATFDPVTRSCGATYCHEGRGGTLTTPRWTDGPSAAACGACHSIPPSVPHSIGITCGLTTCHEGSVTLGSKGPLLTPNGAKVHVNGLIDRLVP